MCLNFIKYGVFFKKKNYRDIIESLWFEIKNVGNVENLQFFQSYLLVIVTSK